MPDLPGLCDWNSSERANLGSGVRVSASAGVFKKLGIPVSKMVET